MQLINNPDLVRFDDELRFCLQYLVALNEKIMKWLNHMRFYDETIRSK